MLAPATAPPVVEATGVTKRYGATTALSDAQITIRPGQTHALVGRNGAGKSTLVSIITGLQAPDEGTVRFGGEPAPPLGRRSAWRSVVACVYQKSTIIPGISVAENLFLNRQSTGGPIRWGALRRRAGELLDAYEVDIDPSTPAADLGVEQRQMVEIARAMSFGARFIVLDEPTAQLDKAAIDRLFAKMQSLKEQGVTFLFISHHLQEVFDVCTDVTVFRDARHILTRGVAGLSKAELVDAMIGENAQVLDAAQRPDPAPDAGVVLRAAGLGRSGEFEGVDLSVRAGEVVGLAGIEGCGKVAVAEVLVGLDRPDEGTVEVAGTATVPGSVPSALRAGLGFVPQDRHRQGLVPDLSVAENATLTITDRLGSYGFVSGAARRAHADKAIEDLAIKTDGPDQPVSGLSGGNAQKVVMARALARDPRALVLITPTAGVDVRSKESLLAAVDDAARSGAGALVVSDELDDLRICDRVVVMFKGRITGDVAAGWSDAALVAAMEGIDQ